MRSFQLEAVETVTKAPDELRKEPLRPPGTHCLCCSVRGRVDRCASHGSMRSCKLHESVTGQRLASFGGVWN